MQVQAQALEQNDSCFNDLKDKESVIRQTSKLSTQCFAILNDNQKERQCSKVNFAVNWER